VLPVYVSHFEVSCVVASDIRRLGEFITAEISKAVDVTEAASVGDTADASIIGDIPVEWILMVGPMCAPMCTLANRARFFVCPNDADGGNSKSSNPTRFDSVLSFSSLVSAFAQSSVLC